MRGRFRPERIVTEIGSVLPTDGAAVIDTLQASFGSGSHMPLKGPSQRFIRCAGSLAGGFPGRRLERNARWQPAGGVLHGDGGFYYP